MSRHIVMMLSVCLSLAGFAGCAGPTPVESFGHAIVAPQPLLEAELPREPAGLKTGLEGQEKGPIVHVQSQFLHGPAREAQRRLGLGPDEFVKIISAEEAEDAVVALRTHTCTRILAAPRLSLYSGRAAFISTGAEQAFVHDVIAEAGPNGETFKLAVDRIGSGVSLTVSAKADGDAVVLTRLEAKALEILCFRTCEAKVAEAGRLRNISWGEAIYLEGAGPVDNPCSIRLEPGQRLLVRMRCAIRQTAANARLLARGPVVESLSDPGVHASGPNAPAPGEMETLLLIKAGVAPAAGRE